MGFSAYGLPDKIKIALKLSHPIEQNSIRSAIISKLTAQLFINLKVVEQLQTASPIARIVHNMAIYIQSVANDCLK